VAPIILHLVDALLALDLDLDRALHGALF